VHNLHTQTAVSRLSRRDCCLGNIRELKSSCPFCLFHPLRMRTAVVAFQRVSNACGIAITSPSNSARGQSPQTARSIHRRRPCPHRAPRSREAATHARLGCRSQCCRDCPRQRHRSPHIEVAKFVKNSKAGTPAAIGSRATQHGDSPRRPHDQFTSPSLSSPRTSKPRSRNPRPPGPSQKRLQGLSPATVRQSSHRSR
jgi:hypothetical protein